MRKDVKLGFAIGAVLLVVLIVYVLAVSGDSGNKTVAQGDEAADVQDGGVSLEPVDGGDAPVPPPAPAAEFSPPAEDGRDPFAPAPSPSSNTAANDDGSAEGAPSKDDWNKILNEQLVLMTETPQRTGEALSGGPATPVAEPRNDGRSAPLAAEPAVIPNTGEPSEPASTTVAPPAAQLPAAEPVEPPTIRPTAAPTVVPPAGNVPVASPKGREHIVQFGETLSSISAAAYGNPNFYPHILRANPTVDPDRIQPGTKIIVPDAATVRPASATPTGQAAAAAAPLDASRQYRVQAGDSLHGIALRLYGESGKSEAIYQLNKQTIGEDPHKLRIGQVLQLPSAPPARAARAQ